MRSPRMVGVPPMPIALKSGMAYWAVVTVPVCTTDCTPSDSASILYSAPDSVPKYREPLSTNTWPMLAPVTVTLDCTRP